MLHNVVFGQPKNLLKLLSGAQSANGITTQVAANGLITLNGNAAANTAISLSCSGVSLCSGTYTTSLTVKSGYATGIITANLLDSQGNTVLTTSSTSTDATVTASGQSFPSVQLFIPSGTVCSQYTIGLQIEAGNSATGWVSPGTQGVIFYPAVGETGSITNSGNVDAYPVITITGTCSNPSITNETTRETIAVNIALGNTDVLVIDCRPATRGCYLNDVLTFGIKRGLGWIHCPPGDNVLTFDRDGYDTRRHCTIALQGRYL